MRIIGGSKGGLVLRPSMKSWPTRPTTDIAKEALYNILMNRIDFTEVTMLDLFGGTGAHTFEFLSRGCKHVTYVEKHNKCVQWVKTQIAAFEWEDRCDIIRQDVVKFLRQSNVKYDFVFADPPYAWQGIIQLPDQIFDVNVLSENAWFVMEHGSNITFKDHEFFTEERKYGQSIFSFFKLAQD